MRSPLLAQTGEKWWSASWVLPEAPCGLGSMRRTISKFCVTMRDCVRRVNSSKEIWK